MYYQAIRRYPDVCYGQVVSTWQEAFDDLLILTNGHTQRGHIRELYSPDNVQCARELVGQVF